MKNDFYERLKLYFPDDWQEFIKLLDEKATHGFFLNTLKGEREDILNLIDFNYKEFKDNSFYSDSESIGKTLAYELGLIYPQDVESSLTTAFLEGDFKFIVDMCAAPGGKSINALNRFKPDFLLANEVNHTRASILSSNFERLGLDNTIITSKPTDKLAQEIKGKADLVLLDAPCSGEGMIRKYPEILDNYSLENILELSKIQHNLLLDAYKICKSGGYIIYSTCTYALEEDEQQIENILKEIDAELVPIDFEYNYSRLKGCIKLCPLNGSEGQFIAILRKKGDSEFKKSTYLKTVSNKIVEKFIKDNIDINDYYLYANKDNYYLSLKPVLDLNGGILRSGIYLGELKKNRFEPSHNLYRSNSLFKHFKFRYDLKDEEYRDFIKGLELKTELEDNYYLLCYRGYALGYGKVAKGVLKNKYPKGLRMI